MIFKNLIDMKNIKKYIYLLGLLVLFGACDAFGPIEDIKPQFKLVEENTFTDIGKTEAALNGVYINWRYSGYNMPQLLSKAGLYESIFASDFSENAATYDNGTVKGTYSWYYTTISRANYVIYAMQNVETIEGLTDERRNEIEGEAKINRAICHFDLLRLYGQFYDVNSTYGIVLMKEPARGLAIPARNTVSECYDFILEDLDFAIANAPAVNDHHRMSQTTAKAYKANVLLYTKDYAGAANVALDAMGDTNYALEAKFRDVFQKGYTSREVLFSPLSTRPLEPTGSTQGFYTDPVGITAIADAEDPVPGDLVTGLGFDKRYAYCHAIDSIQSNGTNMKYPFYLNTGTANSLFLMRMSEVYLIYAEAKARANSGVDTDALDTMNEIRLRANMPIKTPATKADLLEAIRIEKILEFGCEWNQPWYDMIRAHYNGEFDILNIKPTLTSEHRLILPMPQAAMAANVSILQNPGYTGAN